MAEWGSVLFFFKIILGELISIYYQMIVTAIGILKVESHGVTKATSSVFLPPSQGQQMVSGAVSS